MGVLYRVHLFNLKRDVAIKVNSEEMLTESVQPDRYMAGRQ